MTTVETPTGLLARTMRFEPLVRIGWLVYAGVVATLAIAGIAPYLDQIGLGCDGSTCLSSQLRSSELDALALGGNPLTTGDAQTLLLKQLGVGIVTLAVTGFGIWRRPGNPAVVALCIWLPAFAASELVVALAHEAPRFDVAADTVRLVSLAALAPALWLVPDGRFAGRRFAWTTLGLAVLAGVVVATPDAIGVGVVFSVLVAAGTIASFSVKYREAGDGGSRRHVAWAASGVALFVGAQVIGRPLRVLPLPRIPLDLSVANSSFLVPAVGMTFIVAGIACIAVSALHTELIEIEVVLNRTLVYGLLTVIVVSVYVVVVGWLSVVFQGRADLWLSLAATGVIALAFQPIREQVQRLVNHLFYGERDEPYAVLSRLGRTLESALPPDELLTSVVETVAADLKLPYVAIALGRPGDAGEVHAATGVPTDDTEEFLLQHRGDPVGHLIVAARPGETQIGPADRRLLEDLARQASVAARAAQLTDALRRSREELVTAREEERRRLRRDLHDGLGPALATITLQSDTARDLVTTDPEEARSVLSELTVQSQSTMEDVRRLIHALRPPVLDDLGLLAALRALCDSFGGSDLTLTVEVPESLPPLPAAVEVAVYRIAQEALTNTVRHAHATECHVQLSCGDFLELRIRDDGIGLGETPTSGVGVTSMHERAEELGGRSTVESATGGGTLVSAWIPLRSHPSPEGGGNGRHPHPDR